MEKALRIAVVAALLRLLVAPFFGHLWDIKTMQETVYYTLRGENVYTLVYTLSRKVSESTGQPLFYEGYAYLPHLALILSPFYALYLALGGDPQPIKTGDMVIGVEMFYEPQLYVSKDVFLFMAAIKTPIIIADALITYILGKRDLRMATIYALSPYAILITGAWGMFDSLVALTLISSVMLVERGRYALSGLVYGFSLVKLYPLLALPIFMLELRRRGLKALAYFTLGLALSQIPTLLYLALDPQSFIYAALIFHILRQPSGLTPLRMLYSAESIALTSIVSTLHTLVSAAVYLAMLAYILRNNIDIARGVMLALLYFLAFGKVVHEQYYLSLYPLLLQFRVREARLIEWLFTTYLIINVGVFLATPTILFLVDHRILRILQIHATLIYGDIGYMAINVIGPILVTVISIITFLSIVKVMLNIAATQNTNTGRNSAPPKATL